MITVKVIRQSSGDPAEGRKAALKLANGVTDTKLTDRNGEAHFDNTPANGKVFVDGSTVQEGYLSGKIVVYI
ncbi:MAG: hypothetical protein ACR2N3_15550 [Pyrinomonadaceae bacterium]